MIPKPPFSGAAVVEQALHQVFKTTRKHSSFSKTARLGLGLAVLAAPVWSALAADAPAASATPALTKSAITKPNWLTDFSLGVKETYDDNVYLEGNNSKSTGWPADYSAPNGFTAAEKDKASFITTISPKIGFNFAPLIGDQTVLKSLTLAYSPDFNYYHSASTESYDAHRIITGAKIKYDSFSASIDNTFTVINGSDLGLVYPGSLLNAYASGTLRERRSQDQDRLNATAQYDVGDFFARPTASWLNYDLQSKQLAGVSGYQNYADRYDVNGGADLGYKFIKNFAGTIGYRYGHQYQQAYDSKIDASQLSSSSDYQRVLFGFEGKPLSWLDFKLQIGPDFRSYGDHAPVNDRNYTTYYGESSVTATITPNDSITFKYKEFQWVSSTGKAPYFDSLFDLSYQRKIVEGLTFTVGGKLLESDYTSGLTKLKADGGTTSLRDDGLWVLSAGAGYAFNKHASVNIAYNAFLGRNLQNGLANGVADTREYDDNQISIGANFKF
jgi:hypothetical protein